MHQMSIPMRRRTVAVHRHWYRTLWASTTLAIGSSADLFVASHWLEWSSSRSSVTLLIFSRADHRTLQVLTTFYVVFISIFIEGLLQKPPSSSDLSLIGPRPWRHMPRLIVMYVVFRSLLKIFGYAAKQACKQLQCIKTKLSEPASINGLHIHRALGYASQINYTLDENIGGHIYTVTYTQTHIHGKTDKQTDLFTSKVLGKVCLCRHFLLL